MKGSAVLSRLVAKHPSPLRGFASRCGDPSCLVILSEAKDLGAGAL